MQRQVGIVHTDIITLDKCVNVDFLRSLDNVKYIYEPKFREVVNIPLGAPTEKSAYDQLKRLDILYKKFWIEPDFEQYDTFTTLQRMSVLYPRAQSIPVFDESEGITKIG